MLTEKNKQGQRIWSKRALVLLTVGKINYTFASLILRSTLSEVGYEKTPDKDEWVLKTDDWTHRISIIRGDMSLVLVEVGDDKITLPELVQLWDMIRDHWENRKNKASPKG